MILPSHRRWPSPTGKLRLFSDLGIDGRDNIRTFLISILTEISRTERLFCHNLANPGAGPRLTPPSQRLSPYSARASLKLCGKPFEKPAPNWGSGHAFDC